MKTKTLLASLSLLGCFALAAQSQTTLLSDDFEGTLSQWTFNPVSPGLTVSTVQNHTPGGTQSAAATTSSSGMYNNSFATELDGYVKLEYWLYDAAGTRTFADLRSHAAGSAFNPAGISQVFAIGKYHVGFGTPTGIFAGEVVNTSLYQGRILTGPDAGWFNLPGVARTPNAWVKFDLERLANGTVNFYVNDTLSRSVTTPTYYSIDNVFVGSVRAGTTATVGYFDDISVVGTVPEPSTTALALLGGFALATGMISRRKV